MADWECECDWASDVDEDHAGTSSVECSADDELDDTELDLEEQEMKRLGRGNLVCGGAYGLGIGRRLGRWAAGSSITFELIVAIVQKLVAVVSIKTVQLLRYSNISRAFCPLRTEKVTTRS